MARRIARVLIDSPLPQLDRLFDYAVPEQFAEAARVGVRVKVPLRTVGRVVDGYIIELGVEDDADRALSELESVVSDAVVLPEATYALARKVADRAAGSASDVLRLVIPKRQVRVEKQWLAAAAAEAPTVSDQQRGRAESVLAQYPGLLDRLMAERLAVDAFARPESLASGATVGAWAVLLAAAATVTLASGKSAVLVVPDHRDQEQLEQALADFVAPEAVVRADARQTGPERYRGFVRSLEAAPCIVVGNRSAVYSPTATGLVAVWDDGDSLMEEPLAPYIHARDAALVRQELFGGGLLFAGHTRSADVERLVSIGWVHEVAPERKYSPRVVLSSTTENERPGARVPSAAFRAAREALAAGGPVLVQVARPGYAPVLVCAGCRTAARCAHCAGPLHAPARGAAPVCRWCGRTAHGWTCPSCGSDRVRLASSGSERTADELGRAFPGVRIIVADGEHQVLAVPHAPALVIATRGAEPVAAEGYSGIILLDGERMLMADDLRIAESCLRWWSNAAALAAPGAPVHLVSVTGAVARALATWSQPAFARAELSERAPLHMPPTFRVALLSGDPAGVDNTLFALKAAVPTLAPDAVLGPITMPDTESPEARALIRFPYAVGSEVATSLRSSVVSAALRSRRGKNRIPQATLRVRLDVADPQL